MQHIGCRDRESRGSYVLALSIGTTVHPLRDIVWFVYIRKLGQVTLVEASAPQEIEFIRGERNIIVDVFESKWHKACVHVKTS